MAIQGSLILSRYACILTKSLTSIWDATEVLVLVQKSHYYVNMFGFVFFFTKLS